MWLTPVDVVIQTLCPRTGKLLESRKVGHTCIAYCLDEDDRRVLVVGESVECLDDHTASEPQVKHTYDQGSTVRVLEAKPGPGKQEQKLRTKPH